MPELTSPAYRELPWPPMRDLVLDTLALTRRGHTMHGLGEADVTRALRLIGQGTPRVSFTAFAVYCLARAVAEHPMLNAYRKGRKKLVIFDDVDVYTLLEKRETDGSTTPVIYVVRAANRRSLADISAEIRRAAEGDHRSDAAVRRRRRLARLPRPARRLMWRWITRDPARIKRHTGTVTLSNVGAFVGQRPAWGVAPAFHTCTVFLGARYEKATWARGHAEQRTMQCVTVAVDHDIVDGSPAARFSETLARLIESAAGLAEDAPVPDTGQAPREEAVSRA